MVTYCRIKDFKKYSFNILLLYSICISLLNSYILALFHLFWIYQCFYEHALNPSVRAAGVLAGRRCPLSSSELRGITFFKMFFTCSAHPLCLDSVLEFEKDFFSLFTLCLSIYGLARIFSSLVSFPATKHITVFFCFFGAFSDCDTRPL